MDQRQYSPSQILPVQSSQSIVLKDSMPAFSHIHLLVKYVSSIFTSRVNISKGISFSHPKPIMAMCKYSSIFWCQRSRFSQRIHIKHIQYLNQFTKRWDVHCRGFSAPLKCITIAITLRRIAAIKRVYDVNIL